MKQRDKLNTSTHGALSGQGLEARSVQEKNIREGREAASGRLWAQIALIEERLHQRGTANPGTAKICQLDKQQSSESMIRGRVTTKSTNILQSHHVREAAPNVVRRGLEF